MGVCRRSRQLSIPTGARWAAEAEAIIRLCAAARAARDAGPAPQPPPQHGRSPDPRPPRRRRARRPSARRGCALQQRPDRGRPGLLRGARSARTRRSSGRTSSCSSATASREAMLVAPDRAPRARRPRRVPEALRAARPLAHGRLRRHPRRRRRARVPAPARQRAPFARRRARPTSRSSATCRSTRPSTGSRATEPPFLARQHVADSEIHWELTLPDSVDEILGRALVEHAAEPEPVLAPTRAGVRGTGSSTRIFTASGRARRVLPRRRARRGARRTSARSASRSATRRRTASGRASAWSRAGSAATCSTSTAAPRRSITASSTAAASGTAARATTPSSPACASARTCSCSSSTTSAGTSDARVLDYGIGDADYKRRFGTRSWHEGNVARLRADVRGPDHR